MSSNPPIVQYPLDKTGTSPTNKIEAEIHEINGPRERAFVPQGGPFYTESMVITNADTGIPLIPVDDYILCQPFQQASLRTGKDVQCVIWLKTATPISVTIDYQVVGGEYSFNVTALIELLEELDLDDRPVQWGSIIGRPTAYPPAPHIHDIGDTYGWEYVVYQLEGIRNAILVGDEASHDELRAQMQSIKQELEVLINAVDDKVDAHMLDYTNPHRVTKAQVGLGSVENLPLASQAEATAGTVNTRYMTPYLTTFLTNRIVTEAVNAHIADKNNPHGVTKAQTGLGNVLNYGVATQAEAAAGVVSDKYMTPLRTKEAIDALIGTVFNDHVNDFNNPHRVTKAQVGLGLVDNYQTANEAEARYAINNDRFMTPRRTKDAVETLAVIPLNTHLSNYNNPHQVTKAQVGLSFVDNYQTATVADAIAGAASNKFMTPYTTKQMLNNQLGNLNSHLSNYNNPHRVTKAQVGLSVIPNSITRSRGSNTDGSLLTAGSMYDHVRSADHDGRYHPINSVSVDGSIHVASGRGYVAISGAWRQFWPAQWSA